MIAIVDDDAGIRAALEEFVGSLGYKAITFGSAEAFLAAANRDAISCIILDIKMPGLSGLELQTILNAQNETAPVIFMTSHGGDEIREKALSAGAAGFLRKPVNHLVLRDCLRSVLADC